MRTEDLLRAPVFQLNLLLWMAKEQPTEGHRVYPFFHEQGFRMIYIEQPIPMNVFKRIQEHWVDKQQNITLEYKQLAIKWNESGEKDDFLNWLEDRRTRFDADRPRKEERDLFSDLD